MASVVVGQKSLLATGTSAAAQDLPLSGPVLATPGQLAAERLLVKLLDDPDVKAAQAAVRAQLLEDPAASTPDGKARLDHAIAEFTGSLVLHEAAGDPEHPQIISSIDNTAHRWFGLDVPGTAISGDNPDNIYRYCYIDGAGRYEVLGRVDPARRPAQVTFSLIRGRKAGVAPVPEPGKVFLGNQAATLSASNLKTTPDGRFRIALGGPQRPDDANYLPLEPGPMLLLVRNSMSDWKQLPLRLTINRLDPVTSAPRDEAEIKRRVIEHLPGHVLYWATHKNRFPGGLTPNALTAPAAREGAWGYLSRAYFHLAPGEAAVLHMVDGAAAYTGLQVTDPWYVAPDGRKHQTSINTAQARANPDGGFTYVVSADDPGVANWLDTGGMHDGFLLVRWQGLPPGTAGDGLVRDFRVVRIADLGKAGGPPMSPEGRRAQLKTRALEYDLRYGE